MNILFVTGIFPPDRGGPASYVPRMAAALTERGHSVLVICLSDRLDHDDSGYSFRVRRIRRGIFWPARILFTTLAVWRGALRHEVVFVHGLGSESALAAFFAACPAVYKVVGDYAWERAVGRGWFTGTLDDYQTVAKSPVLRLSDWIRNFPLRLAHRIIVPSRYLQRIVSGWRVVSEKIQVVYNATPPVSAAPSAAVGLPAWSGKTLMTVCRLVPWKGVDALIRLLPQLPDTRLVIAGDGPIREQLSALAERSGAGERVLFLGDVPHREVAGYLQQADAFVLNSTYEGLPHVVLEAMAAGTPVIATDAGGTGEVVEHNVTGLLVPVGDAVALKSAIERLWSEPSLGRQLAGEGAARLAARFDFNTMVDATEAVLGTAAAPLQPLPIAQEEAR